MPEGISLEEKEYFKNYDISKYEKPSIAADIAILAIMPANNTEKNYRKPPTKKLKILLIQRGQHPFKGSWALPGGFCKPNEDIEKTAKRELFEETGINHSYLALDGIYGQVNRDPRGWIISHTFMALVDGEKCTLTAGTDACQAYWFDIDLQSKEIKRNVKDNFALVENEYILTLICNEIELSAKIKEIKTFENYHETTELEIVESNGFAFDHSKIITSAILSLRQQTENNSKIVFDLMPETFTLTQLQTAFEIILDKKLLTPNFRRKIADYVTETQEIIDGVGYRPAKLFKRNLQAFYTLK